VRFTWQGHLNVIVLEPESADPDHRRNLPDARRKGVSARKRGLLKWKAAGDNLQVILPEYLPGKYAYVLEIHHAKR